MDVPLKLTFIGVGPHTYKLANSLSGIATEDTPLLVLADRTTIYQIVDVANKWGADCPVVVLRLPFPYWCPLSRPRRLVKTIAYLLAQVSNGYGRWPLGSRDGKPIVGY